MRQIPWLVVAIIYCASIYSTVAGGNRVDEAALQSALGHAILESGKPLAEVQDFTESRVPRMPEVVSLADWEERANQMRSETLRQVIFRGEAAKWRDAKTGVEWLGSIEGGPGYRIKKLRYEALPGLWIPALLYEPDQLSGKVPAILNVNGHDRPYGKAAPYKQTRCINQAKRGMLALNVEWLGMGQLHADGYDHALMNAIDLCGTSGIATHYLAMTRAIDLLLAHDHADPERIAVTGLSGGGWQTIFVSAFDARVKLSVPVAGYSSFRTRVRNFSDLGDSEQTPCDLATTTDYAQMTAMMAPRPTMLVFNASDNCCFAAEHALPPLLEAAWPIFRSFGQGENLRAHINHDPGDHNYGLDNRVALYRMLGDHFFPHDSTFDASEIPCDSEIKSKDELSVALPADNADFHTLALSLSRNLPHSADLPSEHAAATGWQRAGRNKLREVVLFHDYDLKAEAAGSDSNDGLSSSFLRLRLGENWTVPAVELVRGEPKSTVILIADDGRKSASAVASDLLSSGHRVLAVDLFSVGESHIDKHDYLFALLVSAVGDRPLGLQASELAAIARWARAAYGNEPVTLVAVGPRMGIASLVAGAVEKDAIGGLELHKALGSLKEVIEQKILFSRAAELFCFGLLEAFDVRQLVALVAPRPVEFRESSDRVKAETAELKSWYALWQADFAVPR